MISSDFNELSANAEIFHVIYKITNINTGQFYIGKHSTSNISDDYMGSGTYIKSAESKYGLSVFQKEILFIFQDESEAYQKEFDLVQLSNCYPYDKLSYNLAPGGIGGVGKLSGENHPMFGKHHSSEANEKNRQSHLGKIPWNKGKTGIYSKEARQKMSKAASNRKPINKGKHCSEETKEKIRRAHLGKKLTEEHRKKLCGKIPWNKGKTGIYSEETLTKLRIKATGRKHTPKEIEKQRLKQLGKHFTDETKRKISKANKGRKVSEDTRQKISKANKGKRCGKESKTYGMKWMFNPTIKHKVFVKPPDFQNYLNNGYYFGMK